LRKGERDSGCRLTLAIGATPEGSATLATGCEDRGVLSFAPARWHMAGGTLWLTGGRGRLSFERNRKGGWDKAPGQGEALLLAPEAP
ncbi:MAG TPA: AprI/Inh family metalloprotease inhibitor, partial [Beijerinckiaceae bacterium]|nr:AprI/Inh family metalloprotease inhibitor [Beijerinckiaceae bacterium]